MGDFNMNSICRSENYNARLQELMLAEFNLQQYITKVTTDYDTILDLMFTYPTSNNIELADVIDNYWSDHKIIFGAFIL